MEKTLFALSLGFGICALAVSAEAQQRKCGPRLEVIKTLAEKYGESRQSIGLVPRTGIMETFVSAETGNWTIVITLPSGQTCLVAAGESFEALNEELPKPSSAT